MAYDELRGRYGRRANKEYLQILYLAARESESAVDGALRWLMDQDQPISVDAVEAIVLTNQSIPPATDVVMEPVDLSLYDALLQVEEVN